MSFYDAFTDPAEGTLNFVMEYMDGGSLEVCDVVSLALRFTPRHACSCSPLLFVVPQDIVETGGCSSESALANISWRILKVRSTLCNPQGNCSFVSPCLVLSLS